MGLKSFRLNFLKSFNLLAWTKKNIRRENVIYSLSLCMRRVTLWSKLRRWKRLSKVCMHPSTWTAMGNLKSFQSWIFHPSHLKKVKKPLHSFISANWLNVIRMPMKCNHLPQEEEEERLLYPSKTKRSAKRKTTKASKRLDRLLERARRRSKTKLKDCFFDEWIVEQ